MKFCVCGEAVSDNYHRVFADNHGQLGHCPGCALTVIDGGLVENRHYADLGGAPMEGVL